MPHAGAKVSTKWPTRLRASWTVEGTNAKPPTQLIVRSVERTVKLTEKAMVTVEVAGNAAAADGTPAGPAEAPYALLVAQAGGYPTYRPLLYLVWAGLGLLCLGWLLRQFTKGSPVVKWLLRHLPQPPAAVAEPPPDPPVLAAPRPRVRLDRRDPPARPAAGAGAGVGRDAMSPSYLALNEEEGLLDEEEMLYREFEAHQQALQGAQAPGEPAQPPVEEQPQEPRAEEMEGQQHAEPLSATGAKQRRRSALKEGVDRISSSSTTTGERALSHGAAVAEDSDESSSSRAKRAASQPPLSREKALDVLRGLSVLGMVFVNYGGGGYAIFAHSAWDGLTLADLLFPAFVFVSGAAAALSLRRLQQRLDALLGPKGQDESRRARKRRARRVWAVKREALGKVGRRALVLFVLGLFLNNGYEVCTIFSGLVLVQ